MEETKAQMTFFRRLRWAGLLFGGIMYYGTIGAFGGIIAALLAILAAVSFFVLCDVTAQQVICIYVADDLKAAVERAGHDRCVVEIRSLRVGMVTRVYLLGAGRLTKRCSKAVIEQIRQSWYRKWIWVTQMVDLADESEIKAAQALLDEELATDLQRMKKGKQ